MGDVTLVEVRIRPCVCVCAHCFGSASTDRSLGYYGMLDRRTLNILVFLSAPIRSYQTNFSSVLPRSLVSPDWTLSSPLWVIIQSGTTRLASTCFSSTTRPQQQHWILRMVLLTETVCFLHYWEFGAFSVLSLLWFCLTSNSPLVLLGLLKSFSFLWSSYGSKKFKKSEYSEYSTVRVFRAGHLGS